MRILRGRGGRWYPTLIDFTDDVADKIYLYNLSGNIYGYGVAGNDLQAFVPTGAKFSFHEGSSGAGNTLGEFNATIADTETGLLVRRNVGGTLTLQRVTMGAVDSGGAGFKVLRVPN